MDPFKINIVNRCCSVSDNIKEYFLGEGYLADLDQNDMVTPHLLSVIAIDMFLDELSDLGIETKFDAEELMLSTIDLNTMFLLRRSFDKDRFYRFLKSLPELTYGEFCGVMDNVSLPEDLLIEISDFMTAKFPYDPTWEIIQNSLEYWYSTRRFGEHIAAIQEKIQLHSDPTTTPVNDRNVDEIAHFLEHVRERDRLVKVITNYIVSHTTGIDMDRLNGYIKHYDRDKLRPEVICLFAHYDATHPEQEPDFLVHHHQTVYHHLEYWEKMDDTYERLECHGPFGPNKEQMIMIVVSLVLDGLYKDKLQEALNKFKKYTMDEVWSYAEQLLAFDYEEILRGALK